ncbi:MAG TPA: HEAT repeat domain-containing protein [Acidimicrobiales bacterium]|nr:HEAT repeat domain-containing protein [Acidimicrobiales bacterium]
MTGDDHVTEHARRRRQVALAGHAGDERSARAGLGDGHPGTRATALGALARADALTDDDLRAGLADPDPAVRRRACELAAIHPGVELVDSLADGDTTVVEAAAWALGEQGHDDDGTVAALSAIALHHKDPLCREAAVAALGAIGAEGGLAAILVATEDKPAVRRRAVLALAPFEGPEVDAALQRALVDRDWQVRQAAEDLLRE